MQSRSQERSKLCYPLREKRTAIEIAFEKSGKCSSNVSFTDITADKTKISIKGDDACQSCCLNLK